MESARSPVFGRLVLLFLGFVLPTCYSPDGGGAPLECQGHPARALCIPEPEPGEEMRGSITDEWDAGQCSDGEVFAPCERGVSCVESLENCACECDPELGNVDCDAMSLGMAAHGGPVGRSSVCVATETGEGRCIWGQT